MSPRAFNARFKLAMVCPISGGAAEAARSAGFLVSLMGQGLRTDGQVHAHQIKSFEWASRRAALVERASDMVMRGVVHHAVQVPLPGDLLASMALPAEAFA